MEKIIEKECKTHGLTKFVLRTDGKYKCKQCAVDAVTKRRKKLKELAIEYKGNKCEICGYDKCVEALEFHHLDPSKKEFNISIANVKSWNNIKNELDKCILVCANCHREIHFNEKNINCPIS